MTHEIEAPDDGGALTGNLLPAAPAAEMRYEDEEPDRVARVLVRVDYADGRIREYEAREPQEFQISNPESTGSMSLRTTRLSLPGGGGFRPMQAMVPTLRLYFAAHPRYNLHIRTERTAEPYGPVPPTAVDRM
jgi:hypothetical protein